MMIENIKEKPTSDYNAAAAINQRIQESWNIIVRYRRVGKFYSWNAELDAIYGELVGDLSDEKQSKDKKSDYDEWEESFKEINKKFKDKGTLLNNAPEGFQNLTVEQIKKRDEQYEILCEKHLFVKRLEKFLGKGTKFKESADDYMSS